jgi:hypothetical protein
MKGETIMTSSLQHDTTAAAIRMCRGPAELERLLEAKTYTFDDICEAREAGRQEGAETLISIAREYRDLGDSWPKAIRLSIDIKGRLGFLLRDVGQAIAHAGDHVTGECDCKV